MGKIKMPTVVEGAYRPCDYRQTLQQIGMGTHLQVSGLRTEGVYNADGDLAGVDLPVSNGYRVRVLLDATDTYTVQRVWRNKVKGEVKGIYCDDLKDHVYEAGMYVNINFGGHIVD